jgi:hypothetical protein
VKDDARRASAVASARAWYDDVMSLHAVPVRVIGDLWVADGAVPPWHSTILTMRPGVNAADVIAAVEERTRRGLPAGGIADGFADLELAAEGFVPLFEATWIHLPAVKGAPAADWRVVDSPADLARWATLHDYVGVLPEAALSHPRFQVLARFDDDRMTGGAVVHLPAEDPQILGLSNVWGAAGAEGDWRGLLGMIGRRHPRRAVVGYERGDDLERALASGFTPVGTHRVWAPPSR